MSKLIRLHLIKRQRVEAVLSPSTPFWRERASLGFSRRLVEISRGAGCGHVTVIAWLCMCVWVCMFMSMCLWVWTYIHVACVFVGVRVRGVTVSFSSIFSFLPLLFQTFLLFLLVLSISLFPIAWSSHSFPLYITLVALLIYFISFYFMLFTPLTLFHTAWFSQLLYSTFIFSPILFRFIWYIFTPLTYFIPLYFSVLVLLIYPFPLRGFLILVLTFTTYLFFVFLLLFTETEIQRPLQGIKRNKSAVKCTKRASNLKETIIKAIKKKRWDLWQY